MATTADSVRSNRLIAAILAGSLLLSGCAQAVTGEIADPPPESLPLVDAKICFDSYIANSTAADGCDALGVEVQGFAEAVAIFETGAFLPNEAGETEASLLAVATSLEASATQNPDSQTLIEERGEALRAVAAQFGETERLWNLRTADVESSPPSDAAYMMVTSQEVWGSYFSTFFEGPEAAIEGDNVVAELFIELRATYGY